MRVRVGCAHVGGVRSWSSFSIDRSRDSDASPHLCYCSSARLDVYRQLGGPTAIERHTNALRVALYAQLSALRHSNGAPLLNIFGRHHWPNRWGLPYSLTCV